MPQNSAQPLPPPSSSKKNDTRLTTIARLRKPSLFRICSQHWMPMSAVKSFYFIRKAFEFSIVRFTDSFRLKCLKFLLQMFLSRFQTPIYTVSGADPYLFPPFYGNRSDFLRMSQEPIKWTLRVQKIIRESMPRTPLEAFAFGTCFENRSPVILDPRLSIYRAVFI